MVESLASSQLGVQLEPSFVAQTVADMEAGETRFVPVGAIRLDLEMRCYVFADNRTFTDIVGEEFPTAFIKIEKLEFGFRIFPAQNHKWVPKALFKSLIDHYLPVVEVVKTAEG